MIVWALNFHGLTRCHGDGQCGQLEGNFVDEPWMGSCVPSWIGGQILNGVQVVSYVQQLNLDCDAETGYCRMSVVSDRNL